MLAQVMDLDLLLEPPLLELLVLGKVMAGKQEHSLVQDKLVDKLNH